MNVTRLIHPVLVRQLVATQEVSDSHTLLSGELKGPQVQIAPSSNGGKKSFPTV